MKRYRLNKKTLITNLIAAIEIVVLIGFYVYVIFTLPEHMTTFRG